MGVLGDSKGAEPAAFHRGYQYSLRATALGTIDVLLQILLEGGLRVGAPGRVFNLFVVVPEGDEQVVARLEEGHHLVQQAGVREALGRSAGPGVVENVGLWPYQQRERLPPAGPWTFRVLVSGGRGIAHHEDYWPGAALRWYRCGPVRGLGARSPGPR